MHCDVQLTLGLHYEKNYKGFNSIIMSMSASILRNIVSSSFNYPATKIVLSGEIPFNFKAEYKTGTAYVDYGDLEQKVYGWTAKEGFKTIQGCYSGSHMSQGNWNCDTQEGNPLHECVDGNEIFFVVVSTEDNIPYKVELYKAPNFAQKWAEIEEADTVRWVEWINS